MAAPSTQATAGISPKAAAAGIVPTALGVVVAIGNYIITGHFDAVSLGAIIGGPSSGVVASIAAYVAKPGPVHTIIADAAAAVGAVEHADPALVAKVEAIVKAELAKIPTSVKPLEQAVEEIVHPADPDPAVVGASLADPELDDPGYIDPAAQALLLSGGHTHLGDVPAPAPIPPAPVVDPQVDLIRQQAAMIAGQPVPVA